MVSTRMYKAELATIRAKLAQRGQIPLTTNAECTQFRFWVTSLESELVDLTQRFTV